MSTKRTNNLRRRPREGVATLWIIVAVLVAVCMLCFTAEIGNIWLARMRLSTALEAAALAAVDQWAEAGGGGGATLSPRNRGVALAFANTVSGQSVVINTNHSGTAINGNLGAGDLIFGAITSTSPTTVFNANTSAGCGPPFVGTPAVCAQATISIPSLCGGFLGIGSYNVSASTYAQYNCATGQPSLIRVDQRIGP